MSGGSSACSSTSRASATASGENQVVDQHASSSHGTIEIAPK
jgi:hypothetical protein